MKRWHAVIGIALGLAAAWGLGRWVGPPGPHAAAPRHAPMLAEFGPPIGEVVVHHVAGSTPTMRVISAFLQHLPASATAYVVCPDAAAFDEFAQGVGAVTCRVKPVIVDHPVTAWSRDRWVVLPPARPGDRLTLLRPRGEAAADAWPARRGDAQVAVDLAHQPDLYCVVESSPLLFDAGDLLADDRHVFITRAVLERNRGAGVADAAQLVEVLTRDLGRPAVVLDDGPDHHAGMFMMSIGGQVALVGDPALGSRLLAACAAPPAVPGGVDDSADTQARFDAVADRLEGIGYRVQRVPTVVGRGSKGWLTYVNVLLDVDAATNRKLVYLPIYRGADALNAAARATWEAEGFIVREVDCTDVFPHGGTLHCLVNILRRAG